MEAKNMQGNFRCFKKIVIFGDERAGKSTFINQLQNLEFKEEYKPSKSVQTYRILLSLPVVESSTLGLNAYEVRLDEIIYPLTDHILLNCQLILYFFDVTNHISFQKITDMIRKIDIDYQNRTIPSFLIGNKADDENTKIIRDKEIGDFLSTLVSPIAFYEISVKKKMNIENLIKDIGKVLSNDNQNHNSQSNLSLYECLHNNKMEPSLAKFVYKILLLGNECVGKTSFFNRLFPNEFRDNYLQTTGFDEKSIYVRIFKIIIRIQIWDTAGQERYRSALPQKLFQNADGFIVIYDITSKESLNDVHKWIKCLYENSEGLVTYLVGNKIDLIDERKVEGSDAINIAKQYSMTSFEMSCRWNINVFEIIQSIILDIFESQVRQSKVSKYSFQLDNNGRNKKSDSCCSSNNNANENEVVDQ